MLLKRHWQQLHSLLFQPLPVAIRPQWGMALTWLPTWGFLLVFNSDHSPKCNSVELGTDRQTDGRIAALHKIPYHKLGNIINTIYRDLFHTDAAEFQVLYLSLSPVQCAQHQLQPCVQQAAPSVRPCSASIILLLAPTTSTSSSNLRVNFLVLLPSSVCYCSLVLHACHSDHYAQVQYNSNNTTHNNNRFTALWNLSGKTRVSRYQKNIHPLLSS